MTKKEIVVYGDGKPNDWPEAWEFPCTANPPGWPKKISTGCELQAVSAPGYPIIVEVVGIHGDGSDRLNGEFIQLRATAGGVPIRCKKTGSDVWGEAALGMITQLSSDGFGCVFDIEFDWASIGEDDLVATISLYKCEPDLAIQLEI